MMEGPGADSEEKHEPVSDIDTVVVVVGLKALDPEWPIREAIGGIAFLGHHQSVENDPTATLAVHCGNGFDAGLSLYQSTRLSR
jgi:hypothetical protein